MEQMVGDQFSLYFIYVVIAVVLAYGIFNFVFMKSKATEKAENSKKAADMLNQYKYIEINSKVEKFLLNSKYIEQIATWKNDIIYKYIYKDGYLYEFDDIMPESNHRIGIDEKFLCFKQMTYKRVMDPKVIDSLKEQINNKDLSISV